MSDTAAGVSIGVEALMALRYEARSLPLGRSRPVNNTLIGRHRSHVRGRGLDFEELRQYRIGDDIRQMDWKVSNRTRKPHVRVYAEERERPVLLAVDQRLSMFFGSRRAMKSVAAAELAALVGWQTLQNQDRIGGVVFNDSESREWRPRRSQSHWLQFLQQLSDFNQRLCDMQQADGNVLNNTLKRLLNLAGHDTLIYLITDLEGIDETSERLLTQLQQHNDVILGWVFDPMERQLPRRGKLAVSDGEYQVEVDTENNRLHRDFEQLFEARQQGAQQLMRLSNLPVLSISTATPVVQQWRALFGAASGQAGQAS